jgi:uncharacterized phage protein (TIGR02218 family)
MKSAVADYQTRVLCLRIVPVTGITVYMTDHPRDLVMSGHTYISTSGYQFTGYDSRADFSPASIDIDGIAGVAGISRAAVASGVFDGALCYVFATTWTSPVEDQEPIVSGVFGKTSLLDDRFQIGGVSLIDALNQSVGQIYGAACPKTFCGQEYGGCMASLAANTVTGTLTGVTSAAVFADSGRSEADDTFGAGTIQFTSGPNAGLKALEIKSFAGGVITTYEPFYYLPVVGNSYSMVRGCRKRLSDCQNRVGGSNVLNFGGFPWIPTGSTYAQVGQGGQ